MASKEFSQRLKDLRINAGYSQKQVYEHFNIPQSTFSSWEVGKSEPSGEMLIKLCEYYNCDMMKEFKSTSCDMVTYMELKIIEKYRLIERFSPKGKESVDYILNREYELAKEISESRTADNNVVPYSPVTQAAHNDHQNEDGEQEKMQDDLSNLKRPE